MTRWIFPSDRKIRNQKIIELRLAGATLSALGAQFEMSRQAVHSIVKDEEQLLREYLEDMARLEERKSANVSPVASSVACFPVKFCHRSTLTST
jgi:hypothetical protein